MKVLITGGAGFIGHHVVEHILKNTEWEIVTLDRLDVSGTLNRLKDMDYWTAFASRVKVVWHDLKAPVNPHTYMRIGPVDYVLHLAASSHVDRSIDHPTEFVMDNVLGTCHLLDFCRSTQPRKVIFFGTDEVFGSARQKDGYGFLDVTPGVKSLQDTYAEWDRYCSGNPYAATKAGAEELCLAYHNTYGTPVVVSHCMNVFGERQHPEKFIPSTIRKVRDGETVVVHADATRTKPGSRFYIHARNVAAATLFLLEHGQPGDKYNIVGEKEVDNLALARQIAEIVGKPLDYQLVDFHSSRPGHDLRYALDGAKMEKMGWKIPVDFENSLAKTVRWTLEHKEWLE